SWWAPNAGYEKVFIEMATELLAPDSRFVQIFTPFVRQLAIGGILISIARTVLKATMPGVPDFYQGTEFWDFSFVDPDNRRPVDFAARASVLKTRQMPDWAGLARDWPNGHLKLAWTRQLVRLRTELADVFTDGDYQPLQVSGPHRDHVIAFARQRGSDAAIVAVAKSFAVFTDAGRTWPRGDAFQCTLDVGEYII